MTEFARKLVADWASFLAIFLSPLVILLFLFTLGLLYFSVVASDGNQPNAKIIVAFFLFMVSVFSGLLGGILTNRWTAIKEQSVLVTRGKSAIRGLKLLLLNLGASEQRVKDYIRTLPEKPDRGALKTTYEEIIGRYNSLEEEASNAIEEWQDIIPGADIKTQIGVISKLKDDQARLEEEISAAVKNIAETKQISDSEKKKLRLQLEVREKELADVRSQLRKKELEFGGPLYSGLTVHTDYLNTRNRFCLSCASFGEPKDGKCTVCGATILPSTTLSGG